MKRFRDGAVELYAPEAEVPSMEMEVFYNPEKTLCRDISVSFFNAYDWNRKPVVCDLLAGTGVRGLRIAAECDASKVYVNDANPNAYNLMKRNIELNKERIKCDVVPSKMGALEFLGTHRAVDYMDIDPYGSPNPFLVAARKVRRKGVLAVCATDTAALSGTYPRVTRRKYGSKVVRTNFHNEVGLRILIKHVVERGASIEVALKPVFSHSTRHYFRAYFSVDSGAGRINALLEDVKYLDYDAKTLNRKVSDSGNIGPLWCGPLYDKGVVKRMGFVPEHLAEETDAVGYYLVPKVCSKLGVPVPKQDKLMKELDEQGIRVSRCHFHDQGLKINSEVEDLKDAIKSLQT